MKLTSQTGTLPVLLAAVAFSVVAGPLPASEAILIAAGDSRASLSGTYLVGAGSGWLQVVDEPSGPVVRMLLDPTLPQPVRVLPGNDSMKATLRTEDGWLLIDVSDPPAGTTTRLSFAASESIPGDWDLRGATTTTAAGARQTWECERPSHLHRISDPRLDRFFAAEAHPQHFNRTDGQPLGEFTREALALARESAAAHPGDPFVQAFSAGVLWREAPVEELRATLASNRAAWEGHRNPMLASFAGRLESLITARTKASNGVNAAAFLNRLSSAAPVADQVVCLREIAQATTWQPLPSSGLRTGTGFWDSLDIVSRSHHAVAQLAFVSGDCAGALRALDTFYPALVRLAAVPSEREGLEVLLANIAIAQDTLEAMVLQSELPRQTLEEYTAWLERVAPPKPLTPDALFLMDQARLASDLPRDRAAMDSLMAVSQRAAARHRLILAGARARLALPADGLANARHDDVVAALGPDARDMHGRAVVVEVSARGISLSMPDGVASVLIPPVPRIPALVQASDDEEVRSRLASLPLRDPFGGGHLVVTPGGPLRIASVGPDRTTRLLDGDSLRYDPMNGLRSEGDILLEWDSGRYWP